MTDPKPTLPQNAKAPFRWWRAVLFVSLALNLAVAGMVGGAVLGRFGPDRRDIAARDVGFGMFTEALSPADRKALRRAYVQARPDMRADRQKMRDDLETILAALRADPFDVTMLQTALDAGAKGLAARQAQGQVVILDYLSKMPALERARLADRMEESLKRRGHGPRAPRPERE